MSRNKILYLIFILFGLIYCSISLVNNYTFRTFAYDLGIETNSIYDYAHLRWNNCMLLQPQFKNILSDHFSLLTIFFSPLGYIFKSYTLLIIQILFCLAGGYGIYKLVLLKTKNETLSTLSLVHFFVIWGIYSALAYDFHHNVLGAMLLPWFFYYLEKGDQNKMIFCFILILFSKENMALWMIFVCLGLAMSKGSRSIKRKTIILLAIASCLYFVVVIKWIMPALSNHGSEYLHFNFSALGTSWGEGFLKIVKHPIDSFSLLLENQTGNAESNGFKPEFYFMLLLSGGFAIFTKTSSMIMIIPLIAQKMFNDDSAKWGLESHYCIEFVPIIIISFYEWINSLSNHGIKKHISPIFILLAAAGTFNSFENSNSIRYNRSNYRFFEEEHYSRSFNCSAVHQLIKTIPENARVSATTELVPHLSWRETIYAYPIVNDADYIMLLNDGGTYPLTREDFIAVVNQLKNNRQWTLLYDQNLLMIFKRK